MDKKHFDSFQQAISLEQLNQRTFLEESRAVLASAPPGRLFIRERSNSQTPYQIVKEKTPSGWSNCSRNLKRDPDTLLALAEKKLAEEMIKICHHNLPILEKTANTYQALDCDSLISSLPKKYGDVLALRKKQQIARHQSAFYHKAPFDPEKHIHETLAGILVRSKSEVIIANALYSYGIPFHYEEQFPYPDENGSFYYPDFTIPLADGCRLIWEHLGMLNDLSYCTHNARKLHTYQKHDFLIGKNLILTQDDSRGNCSSAFIYQVIEKNIVPYFK